MHGSAIENGVKHPKGSAIGNGEIPHAINHPSSIIMAPSMHHLSASQTGEFDFAFVLILRDPLASFALY